VLDASRAVGVCTALTSETQRAELVQNTSAEYNAIRVAREGKNSESELISLNAARANHFVSSLSEYAPPKPSFIGTKTFDDYPLTDLVSRIDWTPFFRSWELAGTYPAILNDNIVGESARNLFADAQKMLDKIIAEKWLQAKAVIGFWPVLRELDDVVVYDDEDRLHIKTRIHFLRQQFAKRDGRPNMCLADFIAPEGDYIGGFAVTAGHGIEKKLIEFKSQHDDYSDIMLKALADRLAEALAERMHERVRKEFWGYAVAEELSNEDIIREKYRGIRPAPGYPACPDHSEKPELFRLLDANHTTRMHLTESFAMLPTASVSGYYFSHPEASYFGVARIGRDQVEDYAQRRGVSLAQAERWLRPNLGYEV
jgi:5-methyltetrahydrofolate--homocysteine methyltransferase